MELHPTPFPVKSEYLKPKPAKKISEPPKISAKGGSLLLREKRVFGTAWNPNITTKIAPEKPSKGKPASVRLKKPTKPPLATQSPLPGPPIAEAKNSSEKIPVRPKKKSVCFQETDVERSGKNLDDGNLKEPQTPLRSPSAKPKVRVATPYHSAEKCSKCRFDKLETSAYWLSQIKLAESVGKHSVSAAFFQLAFNCKAEPIRNIRVDLKKYLSRHEYLNVEEDWRKLCVSYGLMKEESPANREEVKDVVEEENARAQNREDGDLIASSP
ncbi:hypothetical protein ACS0TY_020406 [Phlomoides rotata]